MCSFEYGIMGFPPKYQLDGAPCIPRMTVADHEFHKQPEKPAEPPHDGVVALVQEEAVADIATPSPKADDLLNALQVVRRSDPLFPTAVQAPRIPAGAQTVQTLRLTNQAEALLRARPDWVRLAALRVAQLNGRVVPIGGRYKFIVVNQLGAVLSPTSSRHGTGLPWIPDVGGTPAVFLPDGSTAGMSEMFLELRNAVGVTNTVAGPEAFAPDPITIDLTGELVTIRLTPALVPHNAQQYPQNAPFPVAAPEMQPRRTVRDQTVWPCSPAGPLWNAPRAPAADRDARKHDVRSVVARMWQMRHGHMHRKFAVSIRGLVLPELWHLTGDPPWDIRKYAGWLHPDHRFTICTGILDDPDHPLYIYVRDNWDRTVGVPLETFVSTETLLAQLPMGVSPPTAVRECMMAMLSMLANHREPTNYHWTIMRSLAIQCRPVLDCLLECTNNHFRLLPWSTPPCHSEPFHYAGWCTAARGRLAVFALESRAYKLSKGIEFQDNDWHDASWCDIFSPEGRIRAPRELAPQPRHVPDPSHHPCVAAWRLAPKGLALQSHEYLMTLARDAPANEFWLDPAAALAAGHSYHQPQMEMSMRPPTASAGSAVPPNARQPRRGERVHSCAGP